MASITLRRVTKTFGTTPVLHGVDLDVKDGEFVVFVGPSGCGKSTLLRLICGLDDVGGGEIAIDGEIVNDVPPAKRGIAMVFQSYALYPHMSVAENMSYALRLQGVAKAEIDARVAEAAAALRLDALLSRKPRQLSGGQRQRVAIGRAIVRRPRIFLFDEPLSNLDAALRVDMRVEIAALKARLGATVVYVTHDQIEAMTLADKIVVMNAGRIEQVGAPLDLYHAPANLFVARFIGSPRMNVLPAASVADAVPGAARAVFVGARPEHVRLAGAAERSAVQGVARVVEHLGSDVFVHVAVDGLDEPLILRAPGGSSPRAGERVACAFETGSIHLFDADGRRLAPAAELGVAA
jgi:multiple sugar transport system ATP-binding protein